MHDFLFTGLDLCHRFPSHLHQRQEMELVRPSPAMDSLQEIQSQGHLGQGVSLNTETYCLSYKKNYKLRFFFLQRNSCFIIYSSIHAFNLR